MDEQQMALSFLFGMADFMHQRSPIFKRYTKARKLHQEIIDSIAKYMEKNQIDPIEVLSIAQQSLSLAMDDQLDHHMFADFIVYPHVEGYDCITKQYLDKHHFRAKEKVEMLEAMMNSYYSVFTIQSRNEADGITTLYDVLNHKKIQIVDGKLGSGFKGNCYLLLRIIPYQDINFQTGLTIIYDQDKSTDKFMKSIVSSYHKEYTKTLVRLYNYNKKHPSSMKVQIQY